MRAMTVPMTCAAVLVGLAVQMPVWGRAGTVSQPDGAPARSRGLLGVPAGVVATTDIEYGAASGKKLLLDVYLPAAADVRAPGPGSGAEERAAGENDAAAAPRPVIIWIHGGGWESGTKNGCPAAQLVPHGYAAVSISYRFSRVAPFPAQIHDCKAAVRWVRANAKEYHFDPDRIGVWGASAGGHLVALLGTSANEKELEGDVGEHDDESSRVQAVCNWFGPTDIVKLCRMAGGESAEEAAEPREGYVVPDIREGRDAAASEPGTGARIGEAAPAKGSVPSETERAAARRPRVPTPGPIERLLGGKVEDRLALAARANPISYVDASDAPFLIVHGDSDMLVPIDQSEILLDALKKAGVKARLHVVKGGGHGFWNEELLGLVRTFFDEQLGVKPAAALKGEPGGK